MTIRASVDSDPAFGRVVTNAAGRGASIPRAPAAESWKLPVRTGVELDEDLEGPPWLVPGLLAKSSITEITAAPKAGKSTLVAAMARSLLDGSEFLGRQCARTPVLWASEQSGVSLAATVAGANLRGDPNFRYLLRCDVPLNRPWSRVVEDIAAYCDREGIGVVVVDTLAPWCRLVDENDASEAVRAMEPLRQLCGRGPAGIISRHARKSGGHLSQSGRGSSAFAGEADILLGLTRPEGASANVRRLEILGRFGSEDPINWTLEANGRITVVGSDPKRGSYFDANAVLEILRSSLSPLSLTDIAIQSQIARSSLQVVLEGLVARRTIIRSGTGHKGDAYRYAPMPEE